VKRLPTACNEPGCPELCLTRYCEKHSRKAWREIDERRGKTAERGYGGRHRKWRQLVLARDSVCVTCKAVGRITVATVADHIVPLSQGGSWSLDNGQGLCASCHGRKSIMERTGGK
jgi:5-methylcytosine-specific restriction protein A